MRAPSSTTTRRASANTSRWPSPPTERSQEVSVVDNNIFARTSIWLFTVTTSVILPWLGCTCNEVLILAWLFSSHWEYCFSQLVCRSISWKNPEWSISQSKCDSCLYSFVQNICRAGTVSPQNFSCFRGERNFHIFYYIHDGLSAEDKVNKYHLKDQDSYRYVAHFVWFLLLIVMTMRWSALMICHSELFVSLLFLLMDSFFSYLNDLEVGSRDVSSLSINRVKFKGIQRCFETIGFKQQVVCISPHSCCTRVQAAQLC